MLPGKRSAGGEEVVVDESLNKRAKIDDFISSAAATSTSTGTSSTVGTMGGGNNSNGTTNGKLPVGGGKLKHSDIDEDLHSRQLAVYGRETMRRLFASNILVSGMQGLGAEIAKNLILAGVKSVTLHDEGAVELWDLSSNFIFMEDGLGKNRALASINKLQELNNSVVISTLTTALTTEQLSKFQVGGGKERQIH